MKQASIPGRIRLLLPEYDPKEINLSDYRDVLIERVLELGTREDVRWLFSSYRKEEVVQFLQRHGQKKLSRKSLVFWHRYFHLPIPPKGENPLWKHS